MYLGLKTQFVNGSSHQCLCCTHTHTHAHLYTTDDVQLALCLSSRLRHSVQLPPSLPPPSVSAVLSSTVPDRTAPASLCSPA